MSNFREFDRETRFLLPPSLDEWLPEQHLARFVVEVIDGLDLSAMVKSYRGTGSAGYHPALLLGLLVYGYATGVFSSRKLERATYDSVAFRFIAVNQHLDKQSRSQGDITVEITRPAAHGGASDPIGQSNARLLPAPPAFARRARAELAAFRGVDAEQSNTLAVDFDGVAVDDGDDPDDAILRDRTHSHG